MSKETKKLVINQRTPIFIAFGTSFLLGGGMIVGYESSQNERVWEHSEYERGIA
jgi:hypothetical protein